MKKSYKKGARFCPKAHHRQVESVQEVTQEIKGDVQVALQEKITTPIVEVVEHVQQKQVEVEKHVEAKAIDQQKQTTTSQNDVVQKKDQKKQKE